MKTGFFRDKQRSDRYAIVLLATSIIILSFLYMARFGSDARREATKEVDLTSYLKDVKKLTINNNAHKIVSIEYGHFEDMFYTANANGYKPKFAKNSDGTEVTMSIDDTIGYQAVFSVYGPSLQSIEISGPAYVSYHGLEKNLTVINRGGQFNLLDVGEYGNVKVTSTEGGTSRLERVSIKSLDATVEDGFITAGPVGALTARLPTDCARAPYSRNSVIIASVDSGTIVHNGSERPAQSTANGCSRLIVGARD